MGLTNIGFAQMAKLTVDTGSPTKFNWLATGTGTTAFAATQTALVTELTGSGLLRSLATISTVTTTVTDDTSQLAKTFSVTGTQTLAEVGVFDQLAVGGKMLARTVLSPTRSVVSGDSYTLTYKIQFA